jgi:thiamine biosynthesis lipoprotein
MSILTRRFRCMTTDIELFLDAGDEADGGPAVGRQAAEAALADTEAFFHQFEARFSRFLPDSELSVLNNASGAPAWVSPEMAELVEAALQAAELSGGVFDPTVIDALEAAGYDQSIEVVRARSSGLVGDTRPGAGGVRWITGRWAGVTVDRSWNMIALPRGIRLDLGGIGKGWAVDRAAEMLRPLGPGMVNAGGDLRAWGDDPDRGPGAGWLVAVDDPLEPGKDVTWLRVKDRAVATSSVVTRRWAGGHHLIDPRTGRPADTDLLSATVLSPTAAQAEVAAKVALILGRERGLAWLAEQDDTEALLGGSDGKFYGSRGISGAWL